MLNDGHGLEEKISIPSCNSGIGAPASRQGERSGPKGSGSPVTGEGPQEVVRPRETWHLLSPAGSQELLPLLADHGRVSAPANLSRAWFGITPHRPHPELRRASQAVAGDPGVALAGVTIQWEVSGSGIQGLKGMEDLRVELNLQPSASCFCRAQGKAQGPLNSPPTLAQTISKGLQ